MISNNKSDFTARIQYLTKAEGGRHTPVANGYRPHIEFTRLRGVLTSGQQQFINREVVNPGDAVEANVTTWISDSFIGLLSERDQFLVSEGAQVVGVGTIHKINRIELSKTSVIENYITEETLDRYQLESKENFGKSIWGDDNDDLTYLQQLVKNLSVRSMSEEGHPYRQALDLLISKICSSDEVKAEVYKFGAQLKATRYSS